MRISPEERLLFPITSVNSFLDLIDLHLKIHIDSQPNLAYISVLLGYLEHELTVNKVSSLSSNNDAEELDLSDIEESMEFPILHLEIVEGLLEHFISTLKSHIDKSLTDFTTRAGFATKNVCKFVSDILWNGLLRTYHKDKAHIQSLFSYLTGKQLDCYGLAFAVVASCQILKYHDVHLVLSGDHAWVAHGEDSKDMVEVTWHGKGTEDRRGYVVNESVMDKNWIYHSGNPVKCDRWMELASVVVALNPSIDAHLDSIEMKVIQYKLLDRLYDRGHLDNYPMALTLYCELSETLFSKVEVIQRIEQTYDKALHIVRTRYNDYHVLPYCGKGHFCLRHGQCKEAIKCYARAAQVASKYNYVKDDEELYKEMIDIASEHIPQALKDDPSLCEDKQCYFDVVSFYDGICLWEEDSPTPVLHSWWARYFTGVLSRFTAEVRESFKDERSITSDDHNDSRKRRSTDEDQNSLVSSEDQKRKDEKRKPISKLQLCSQKMIDLKDILTNGKKLNTQSVGLLLTAQSQVHFVKRRSKMSDYEYSAYKRVRRSRDYDS